MLFAVGITRAGVLEAIQGEAEALEDAPSAPDPFAPSPSWGRATVLHALAKVRAWARGAPSVKTEDMFVAIIIEDQPALAEAFPEIHGYPGLLATLEAGTHAPFFSLDLARRLLDGLAAVQSSYAEEESREPRNRTVGIASPELLLRPPPPSVLVPMSDPVNRCFMAADRLRVHLGRTELQPLHLLAALVEDPSSRGAQLFHDAGVTRDSVLRAARGEAS